MATPIWLKIDFNFKLFCIEVDRTSSSYNVHYSSVQTGQLPDHWVSACMTQSRTTSSHSSDWPVISDDTLMIPRAGALTFPAGLFSQRQHGNRCFPLLTIDTGRSPYSPLWIVTPAREIKKRITRISSGGFLSMLCVKKKVLGRSGDAEKLRRSWLFRPQSCSAF